MVDEALLERATEAFLKGAEHIASQGVSLDVIVNSLISAAITVCYAAHEPPEKLKSSLYAAANQVVQLYERQDQIRRGKSN